MYAYEMTFPEFLKARDGVMNMQGKLIGGIDRRNDDPKIKWLNWQNDTQAAGKKGLLKPEVMHYFQETKHLLKPPAAGDTNTLLTAPIDPSLILKEDSMAFTPPRFTWSWSQYSSFLQCPAKWLAEKYFKIVPYVESEAMKVGNLIHETAEHYVKSKIGQSYQQNKIHSQYLPQVQKYCDVLVAAHAQGAEVHVEKEMCFTDKFKFCGWWDNDIVWYRGKADVLIVKDNKLTVWDYKSGAVKPDFMQLKMMCAFSALHFPQAELFDGKLIFTKHGEVKGLDAPMTRSELRPVLQEIIANVRRMEETWSFGDGPAIKSGLCRQYCGNYKCPHSGNYRGDV